MGWVSSVAVYFLIWVFTLFLVLPYRVRTSAEEGQPEVPGQAPSAPHDAMMGRKLLWTTVIATLLFGLFLANWEMGWISRADMDRIMPGAPQPSSASVNAAARRP
jgi:predicted secreted protein